MISKSLAIGIDVGGTGTKGGLVDAQGQVLARLEHPTEEASGTKGAIEVGEQLLDRGRQWGGVDAIGIGAAGFVDATEGSITFAPNVSYDDPHLGAALRDYFDLPIFVDNDANAAAWGEFVFGAGRGLRNMAMFTIGTGVGSGFVVDGRLLRGATGAAAEFGHVITEVDGPECTCGLHGCLEALAGGWAIRRDALQALAGNDTSSILDFAGSLEGVTAKHVAQAAREQDPLARAILARAGRFLGAGLSNAVNVFDPDTVVLGGSVVLAGEPYLGPARDELARLTGLQRRRPMRLDVTRLEHDAGIIGAAALALVEQPAHVEQPE